MEFTAEEQNERARTGAPTSLAKHNRGLATIISKMGRDASGHYKSLWLSR